MNNIITLIAVAVGCLILGYVAGQNTTCIKNPFSSNTTCIIGNPLK